MSEEISKKKEVEKKSKDSTTTLLTILVAVMVLVLIFNSVRIMSLTGKATSTANTNIGSTNTNTGSNAIYSVIPTGVPAIYGNELGVKYDDVSVNTPQLADPTIRKLAKYEGDKLTDEQMKRYITIGSSIACEYCCGAKTLIFSDGEAACGCAHSYAMR